MKKIILHAFVIVAIAISFGSCTKETIQEITGSMKATIDGTAWEATLASQAATKYGDYIAVGGYNIAGQKILIAIYGLTVGTYDLSILEGSTKVGSFFIESKDGAESERFISSAGQVEITSIDEKRISGTFHFTAVKTAKGITTKEITAGEFKNVLIISAK